MEISQKHQETGEAWNETAAIYERDEAQDIAMLQAGGSSLLAPERRVLGDLSGWCQRAIHLQCAGGTDTLSLWQAGSQEVVGVDISERMLACARRKTAALNAPAQWVCSDILQTPEALNATADLVYTGRGALPWMMDIEAWARVAARLLKLGGKLFVFEGHPLDWVWDTAADSYRLDTKRGNYFTREESSGERWPAPFLAELQTPESPSLTVHEKQWTLGDILNSLIAAGLQLEHFAEYPDLYWDQFPHIPPELASRLPHTFSMTLLKG